MRQVRRPDSISQRGAFSQVFIAFGVDPYRTDIDVLRRHLKALPSRARRKLLLATAGALHTGSVRRREDLRVGAVKVLIALHPQSKDFLREWLRHTGAEAFEVHFSILCFLDDIRVNRREVLGWVQQYLRDVRAASGRAAWMAGDLLGDHWPLAESLPVLIDAARTARFAAGRAGALHGLDMAAGRLSQSDPWRPAILRALRGVQDGDRSTLVRSHAAAIHRSFTQR